MLYYKYSDYLKNKYGEKVYKLPVNLDGTCPNRDGTLSTGGCTFCDEKGSGFETHSGLSVKEQLLKNRDYIGKAYGAKKFIAYFQTYTNTYMPFETFKNNINQVLELEDVVEISLSTRPDCISIEILDFLKCFSENNIINISFELGLQTVNYHTLDKINRGHGLAEFIQSVLIIQKYGFEICVHLILNLPWDNMRDVVECARIVSALECNAVKLHSLYIIKDTKLGEAYENKEIELSSKDDYIERVVTFLENLSPDIAIQRLLGRAPKSDTLFCNWDTSWWKIQGEIEEKIISTGRVQGSRANLHHTKI